LVEEIETNDKRLENIMIKLIDQQKKVQLEQKRIYGYVESLANIMVQLTKEK